MKKRFDERFGIGFGISIFVIIVLLSLLLTNYLRPLPDVYFINFYSEDELITTEKITSGSTISEKRLDEIATSYLGKTEYKYDWSYSKDYFRKVNFNLVSRDTNVYLFTYIDEFKVNVIDDGSFEYEISSDGPIISGSSVMININQQLNPEEYHMNVYANNQLIEMNENGVYLIENITQDVTIHVEYLEILHIKPILLDNYVYDSSPKDIGYIVKDYHDNDVDISDILMNYYNSSGGVVDEIVDAGEYKTVFTYVGKEYYIDPVDTIVKVDKAIPSINVDDKYVYYDGSPQGFNSNDVQTNSDGLIEFTNNSNIDVGSYLVDIKIKESKNYYEVSTKAYLNILKSKPNISENPIADVGFEGHTLEDVGFIDGIANTPGTYKWKDPGMILDVGINEYDMIFIPDDLNSYEQIEFKVSVETITYEEQLRRIKSEREKVVNDTSILDGNKLATKTQNIKADIIWMSLSSTAMVDSGGNITVIGSPGTYTVDIIGVMMYGDAAEYVTITLNIVIDTGGGIQLSLL